MFRLLPLFFLLVVAALGSALSITAAAKDKGSFKTRLLLRAAARRDSVELQRAADLLGIAGLRRALASRDRTLQRAAIEASTLADQRWFLLGDLIVLSRGPLGIEAINAARSIAEQVSRDELALREEGRNTTGRLQARLLAVAHNSQLLIEVREAALLTIAQLRDVLPASDVELLAFLKLPQAQPRQAAIELFSSGANSSAIAALAAIVAKDPAEGVARAAASCLCAQLSSRGEGATVLSAMKSSGASSRLAELALDSRATTDQSADIARCLRRSRDRGDRAALRKLRRRRQTRRAIHLVR